MMGQKCLVTLKMHQQLYKEHLHLQKSFCALYQHMSEEKNTKDVLNWIQEKNKLESLVNHYKSKAQQLQRKVEETNERCDLLEFCFLELENQAKVCRSDSNEEKAVNTEDDLGYKTWERCLPNGHHVSNFPSRIARNTGANDCFVKEKLPKSEMESENCRLQLEETQEKLSSLTEQLDNVLKCNCKLGVGMDYVIATVNELQSLMDWTADKNEPKADSSIIFQKLQQLERIQKDLEKSATESEQIRHRAEQERTSFSTSEEKENSCKDLELNVHGSQVLLLENCIKETDFLTSTNTQTVEQQIDDNILLIDLNTPESTDVESSSPLHNAKVNDPHDSLGPNISEDEGLGDESRRGDSTGPSSFIEIHESIPGTAELSTKITNSLDNQIVVIDTEGYAKTKEWNDAKDPESTLDICLCAIGNLRESLRAKENELLKLSAIQNDQKQIASLQDVIVNLHQESLNLRTELEATKKENAMFKEQILELEEAENDSRLQAQKLGEKLVFLQEKDTHFQAKLCETKQALEKCVEKLSLKDVEEQELRSQLKYVETLVQKYEDQIRTLEIVELALRKKLIEEEDELKAMEKLLAQSKTEKLDRGTQMYDPHLSKIQICDNNVPGSWKSASDIDTFLGDKKISIESVNSSDQRKYANVSIQVTDKNLISSHYIDCSAQTEKIDVEFLRNKVCDQPPGQTENVCTPKVTGNISEEISVSTLSQIPCPIQKELLKRLHQLVEEDAHLQQQLHYVDQINLTLWKKLHNLEFHIGECKKRNISEDGDSCIESECDFSSRPVSREQMRDESTCDIFKCSSPCSSKKIMTTLDQSEQEIKERLIKLEQINTSFEKELEIREKLYMEKERKYGEWVQTEQRFIGDLKRLSDERDSLKIQVEKLEKEKEELFARVVKLQTELEQVKEKHESEIKRIKEEQDKVIVQLQLKVDQLLAKEKEHLKQITNLKLERNKSSDKSESDKLKSSYVELQLELSRTRDDMRKKEEEFRIRLDEYRSKYVLEEARLISELEMLRNKNTSCDEMISSFHSRQKELVCIVKEKEHALELARMEYKKNVEATEEEHRTIEAELKNQLRQMEEGTSVATKVLTEEKMRLERELQENIDDLRGKEEGYKARIAELESNVTHLHEELHRITGDIDSGFASDISNDGISSFRREKLLNQLKELRIRETELREKLDEMEQKEAAYRETLEHADRIVASVEQGYKHKIEELEISEKTLKQRVGHLEEIETCLRGALHKERRSSDGRKPDDLVVELLEAESRENTLKEKIDTLEQMQRNAMSKLKELEKLREKLESQLNDKEELASNLERTQQELDYSRKSLAKLRKSENDLKTSLQQTENVLATTETQMKNKIRTIEEEKSGLEQTIRELRVQVRELKIKLEKVSEEREEKRLSMNVPKQSVPNVCISQTQNDEDEPDYVDVDDFPMQSQQGYAKNRPSSLMYNRGQLSRTPVVRESKQSKKISNLQKDDNIQQSSVPNLPDTYDSARQNLEDCMLRAMAAMKKDMEKKVPSEKSPNEDNDYDEVLPRPTNFRVVQQVGSDTLLVGWNYVNPSILEGFEVYLNGHLLESVYAPDRTKALISGLNLKRPIYLSICALSKYGQMSEPAALELIAQKDKNNGYEDDGEDEDEENTYEDSAYDKQRPYSMEW